MSALTTTAQAESSVARLAGKYLSFRLDTQDYGVEILKVREIIRMQDVTRVPRAREHVVGVINLRGKVVPVVDLRRKLGLGPLCPTEQTVIIVVQFRQAELELTMGVLVDEVLEVVALTADELESRPALGGEERELEFLLAVGKSSRRVVFLLDIGKVLSTDEALDMVRLARPEREAPSAA
jgi:purine-binding chemotaxis protein CheW